MTNAQAMTALKSLSATNRALETTQSRISTGYRVAEASDNAAYWSIATDHALGQQGAVHRPGRTRPRRRQARCHLYRRQQRHLGHRRDQVAPRRGPRAGVDRTKIQADIAALQNQLVSNAGATSFSGENWLSVDSSLPTYSSTKSIVSSFTRASDGTVTVSTVDIDISSLELFDAADQSGILDSTFTTTGGAAATVSVTTLDITVANIDDTDIDDMIKSVDNALRSMTTSASDLGAAKKRISLQQNFVETLMDAIERGLGQLVDADMNKESTKLQALLVQQQLGIQALSIANGNAQGILALFRN